MSSDDEALESEPLTTDDVRRSVRKEVVGGSTWEGMEAKRKEIEYVELEDVAAAVRFAEQDMRGRQIYDELDEFDRGYNEGVEAAILALRKAFGDVVDVDEERES